LGNDSATWQRFSVRSPGVASGAIELGNSPAAASFLSHASIEYFVDQAVDESRFLTMPLNRL
jgi:hypothetical protein